MRPIRAGIYVAAPPRDVFEVVLDVDLYPEWNPFTPRLSVHTNELKVGLELDLDCQMTADELLEGEREVVLALDREALEFSMGTSRTRGRPGIRSVRQQLCRPEGNGTWFSNSEHFTGTLAPVVMALYARKLKVAFERYCRALKARAESVQRSTSTGE